MAPYTLPRETFDLLEEALGERGKAEKFARAMESAIDDIREKAKEEILDKKEVVKIEIKEDLKKELVTREIFEERFKYLEDKMEERFKYFDDKMEERFKHSEGIMEQKFKVVDERFKVIDERFKMVDEKFNALNFRLNIFIAIALLALTLANPTFVGLMEKIFKF
ncbi:MAG: hypothetical protein HZA01_08515 [Nitrospinae bacterium]|nr:hypothetical protein [Nitrospinota bacterium]